MNSRWDWTANARTDKELKELAKDLYDMKIFTSFQCDSHDMLMVFMPLLFINAPPSKRIN